MASYTLQITLSTEQVMALKAMGIPMVLAPAISRPGFIEPLPASPEPSGKKVKKAKKIKDPSAPKREPSDWIKFTSRVRSVLKEQMEAKSETVVNKKGETVPRVPQPKEVTQIASSLKATMASCTEDDILVAYYEYREKAVAEPSVPLPPAPAEAKPAEPEAEETKKPRKPWSEETKKAAAEKRAAKKAAALPPTPEPVPVAIPEDEETEDENDVLAFASFTNKGQTYLKNIRGDVVTEDMQWVGRWNESKKTIDRKIACPVDLGL